MNLKVNETLSPPVLKGSELKALGVLITLSLYFVPHPYIRLVGREPFDGSRSVPIVCNSCEGGTPKRCFVLTYLSFRWK